ncbi:hypothetical protein B296_00007105 [Ensete ventricosum]|uniref:Calmodulin-binding domain-containing protein n=1 Tax=Ensete ventricosum TaxID=4639 RepID=A0A427AQY0_ENSVE|nr:hypothetical protein B296_00007105 [Ensete ventricosum]
MATNSRAMGLAAPWYSRGRTSVESSIPCSYGWRTLVVKEAEEVENAEANSKYQDNAERVEAKELHKTDVNGLFIKIAESVGTLGPLLWRRDKGSLQWKLKIHYGESPRSTMANKGIRSATVKAQDPLRRRRDEDLLWWKPEIHYGGEGMKAEHGESPRSTTVEKRGRPTTSEALYPLWQRRDEVPLWWKLEIRYDRDIGPNVLKASMDTDAVSVNFDTNGGMKKHSTGGMVITGSSLASTSKEKPLPHYLRASTNSCHDFCKYGRRHASEAETKPPSFLPNLNNKLKKHSLLPSTSKEKPLPHYIRASYTNSCHDFCKYGRKHAAEAETNPSFHPRSYKMLNLREEPYQANNLDVEEIRNRPAVKTKLSSHTKAEFSDKPDVSKQKATSTRIEHQQTESSGPRGSINVGDLEMKKFRRIQTGEAIIDSSPEAQTVVLKHQEAQEKKKKNAQYLCNNMIKETVSKMLKTGKSKVKALIDTYETMISISLRDNKPESAA